MKKKNISSPITDTTERGYLYLKFDSSYGIKVEHYRNPSEVFIYMSNKCFRYLENISGKAKSIFLSYLTTEIHDIHLKKIGKYDGVLNNNIGIVKVKKKKNRF